MPRTAKRRPAKAPSTRSEQYDQTVRDSALKVMQGEGLTPEEVAEIFGPEPEHPSPNTDIEDKLAENIRKGKEDAPYALNRKYNLFLSVTGLGLMVSITQRKGEKRVRVTASGIVDSIEAAFGKEIRGDAGKTFDNLDAAKAYVYEHVQAFDASGKYKDPFANETL